MSFTNFRIENPVPANLFSDTKTISCEVCGADLLSGEAQGNYITFTPFPIFDEEGNVIFQDNQIKEIHFACKGKCDCTLCNSFRNKFNDRWNDIDDLKNPTIWINQLMAFINGFFAEQDLSENAFKTMKQMFIRTYPYVARNMTTKEKERVKSLLQFGLMG